MGDGGVGSGSVDCGCHQLSENVWLYGSEKHQLDRFRTQRYNLEQEEEEGEGEGGFCLF